MSPGDTQDDTSDNAEEQPDAAPDSALKGESDPDQIWVEDEDVQIQREIVRRERRPGGLPALEDIIMMEVLVTRIVRGSVLLQDLADATTIQNEPPRPAGLAYIADAMNRDAVRLYRHYHGKPPGGT